MGSMGFVSLELLLLHWAAQRLTFSLPLGLWANLDVLFHLERAELTVAILARYEQVCLFLTARLYVKLHGARKERLAAEFACHGPPVHFTWFSRHFNFGVFLPLSLFFPIFYTHRFHPYKKSHA